MMRTGTTTATYLSAANRQVFDQWAQVYDSQLNPLLSLEERAVTPLLPPLADSDVLDVGCGTGRWLSRLQKFDPRSLSGVDCSAVMLKRAREKVRDGATLYQSECSFLPSEDAAKTFVLVSFVLSYLPDLRTFARECARILSPCGCLLISDVHPVTAAERVWKRSFTQHGRKIEIADHQRAIDEIVSIFTLHDFDVEALVEPSFAPHERAMFESAGKLAEYVELIGKPAIYILKLKKRLPHPPKHASAQPPLLQLAVSHVAAGPDIWASGPITIEGECVANIGATVASAIPNINLTGYFILPGLINAHDHLEFSLFPNLGRSANVGPYKNATQWARDIHDIHSSTIEHYLRVPKTACLWWGAIHNLLSGVTTVCHHNPVYLDFEQSNFPIHVVSQFGWSHSLEFDPLILEKFRNTPPEFPFILHAAEGTDDASRNEILRLDGMHLLDKRTVVVHGLALTSQLASLIERRGSSLITCPTSNYFLFEKTLSKALLTSIERVALGTDSAITAAGDLLNEIHYLSHVVGVDERLIYKMVTCNSAEMLRLQRGEGRLVEGGVADMIAVRSHHKSPASILSTLTGEEIELTLVSGQVRMASSSIYARLPHHLRDGMELLEVGGQQRWIRAPIQKLLETAEGILGHNKIRLHGKQVSYLGTL